MSIATIDATNATFSSNTSQASGGAMAVLGSAHLSNVTIARNTADVDGNDNGNGGGIYAGPSANIHFKNSILADTEDASHGMFAVVSHDCLGTLNADGNVLVGVGNHATLCTIGGSLSSRRLGSMSNPLDPGLGDLESAPNGDTMIHPQLEDSPAVEGGSLSGCTDYTGAAITEDQRGENRPIGLACDIGAYESTFTPAMPYLSILGNAVVEGDSGTVTATFTVSLSTPANWLVLASYKTRNGSALAGLDYGPEGDDLVFQPGETVKTFVVQVYGDTLDEDNEYYEAYLYDEQNAIVDAYLADGFILDDDGFYRVYLPLLKK